MVRHYYVDPVVYYNEACRMQCIYSFTLAVNIYVYDRAEANIKHKHKLSLEADVYFKVFATQVFS